MNFRFPSTIVCGILALSLRCADAQVYINPVATTGPDLQAALIASGHDIDVYTEQLPITLFRRAGAAEPEFSLLFEYGNPTVLSYTQVGWYRDGHAETVDVTPVIGGPNTAADATSANIKPSTDISFGLTLTDPLNSSKTTDIKHYYSQVLVYPSQDDYTTNPDMGQVAIHDVVFADRDSGGKIVPETYIVAWDTYYGGGDRAYNNYVMLISEGVVPAPEPGALPCGLALASAIGIALGRKRALRAALVIRGQKATGRL